MDMQEFYDFHGITRTQFAALIGVSANSLHHYEHGYKVSEETKLRVEIGIDIMEGYKLIYKHTESPADKWWIKRENALKNDMFSETFKQIILIEL
jgi:DNA-binding XRE family transcriptional regulator